MALQSSKNRYFRYFSYIGAQNRKYSSESDAAFTVVILRSSDFTSLSTDFFYLLPFSNGSPSKLACPGSKAEISNARSSIADE